MSLGSRLKECRKLRGLSQKQLAERIDISPIQISRYENDLSVPSATSIAIIGRELDLDLNYWIYGDDSIPRIIPESSLKLRRLIGSFVIENKDLIYDAMKQESEL